MNAYDAYWYILYMHKFRGSILDSFDRCFVIIKKGEIVEPLFDFDDTKTLVLLFLIKLLNVSEMNLNPKAKFHLQVKASKFHLQDNVSLTRQNFT